jgi:hypothetical protein
MMQRNHTWAATALAVFGLLAFAGSCTTVGVSQAEFDALTAELDTHRAASRAWAWRIKIAVDCLEKHEYNFPEDVVDENSQVVDCTGGPIDPPSTPPPNSGWE